MSGSTAPPPVGWTPVPANLPGAGNGMGRSQRAAVFLLVFILLIAVIGQVIALTTRPAEQAAPPRPAPVIAAPLPERSPPPLPPTEADIERAARFEAWTLETRLPDHMGAAERANRAALTAAQEGDVPGALQSCRELVATSREGMSTANSPDPVLNQSIEQLFTDAIAAGEACLQAGTSGAPLLADYLLVQADNHYDGMERITARIQLAARGSY